MLTAIHMVESRKNRATWLFRCECGKEVERVSIYVRSSLRRFGSIPNCGCRSAVSRGTNAKRTHGQSRHPLYDVHRQMLRRCNNPGCKDYPGYGARGIIVCREWAHVNGFIAWSLQSGYQQGLTIERVNNNLGYSPDNCRWIPNVQQAANTRRTRKLVINGETISASELSRRSGLKLRTIIGRLNREWPDSRLTEPPH